MLSYMMWPSGKYTERPASKSSIALTGGIHKRKHMARQKYRESTGSRKKELAPVLKIIVRRPAKLSKNKIV